MLASKFAVLIVTFGIGLGASGLVQHSTGNDSPSEAKIAVTVDHSRHATFAEAADQGNNPGWGSAACNGRGVAFDNPPPSTARITSPLRIISKRKAQYTEEARNNGIQGTVTLRVTFDKNGTIGPVTTVRGLPYGLTEQAILAAREMKFEPEKVNGVPRTTSRPVSFTFNIY